MKRITVILENGETATYESEHVPSPDQWTRKHFQCADGLFAALRVVKVEEVAPEVTQAAAPEPESEKAE